MKNYLIAIIGAGPSGVSVLKKLSTQPGFEIDLFDEQSRLGGNINRKKIEEKFPHFGDNAIMHALLGSILFDNPTGCALLGQRNENQASEAGELCKTLSKDEASWILSLYKN